MKRHCCHKSKVKDSRLGYRKLTSGVRKYINGWFHVYCENTSLHGFRYVTMDGSTIYESVVWFIVCALSVVFCVILMLRLWATYSKNPIVTTIDMSNPIWDLSFPGVTICNNNKVYRPHAEDIAKYLHMNGFSANESDKFFSSLMKLIRPDKIATDNITATQVLNILGMTVEKLMNELMQPCSALLVRCAWIGQIYDCGSIFKTVKSKEGFCCAFNSHYKLNASYGFNDKHDVPKARDNFTDLNVTFTDNLPGVREILQAPGSGRDVGLAIALNLESDNYKGSVRPYVGASVLIHDPIDFPDIGAHIASVPPGHVLAISVSGTSVKSMDSIRELPLEKRLCFFNDEVPGESEYSFQSCMSQCIAKQIQMACGCLPFYYPDIHTGIRTCYLTDIDCILARRRSLSAEEVQKAGACNCLPQCTDKTYNIDIEDIQMDDVGYDSEITRDLDIRNMSFVHVYFGDISYVEYRKESILSWDGLLASFGGIFGLCLGGSVMSAVELLYLLARELFRLRKRRVQSRRGLAPASQIFLSLPAKKLQSQKNERFLDKRVFIIQRHPAALRLRNATNFDDVYCKRVKF